MRAMLELDRLVAALCEARARAHVGTFGDEQCAPRAVLIRHDVDLSLDAAVALGEALASAAIRSTFFLRLRGDGYNLASGTSARAIQALTRASHRVGLHWEPPAEPLSAADVNASIVAEFERFASLIPAGVTPVGVVSVHRPPSWALRIPFPAPFANTYATPYFDCQGTIYQSDANGGFDWDKLTLNLRDDRWRVFQLLIHPEWWTVPAHDHASVYDTLTAQHAARHAAWLSSEVKAFGPLHLASSCIRSQVS